MHDLWSVAAASLTVGWQEFATIALLGFGLFLFLAGIFTAYFGSGKSRMIGYGLLVVGLVAGLGAAYWYHATSHALGNLLIVTIAVVFAAAAGALLAVGIFLFAIMKS